MQTCLSTILGLSLIISACENTAEKSRLNDDAKAVDTSGTSVGRLVDGSLVSAYLQSNSAYYRLECPSLLGLEQLIQGLGYPLDKLKENPTYTYDQLASLPGARLDFALSCDLGRQFNARLVKLVDAEKYFISYDEGGSSKFVLRMLGCSSLIAALGFDQSKALPVTSVDFDIFNAADTFDINCHAGVKPSPDQVLSPYVLAEDKAQLFRIRDVGDTSEQLALFNKTKAFKLECAGDADASRRLQAFGFDKNLAWLTPIRPSDSQEVVGSDLRNQAVLKCNDSSAQLKTIDWPAGRKYYLFYQEVREKAVLHEVGCRELLEYVNPDLLNQATPIDPETAAAFYSYTADNKLECLRGTPL